MQNTEIFLIRHGDVENPDNIIYDGTISLSEFGKEKMRKLGSVLRAMGAIPDAFISSPFLRTMQSSEAILSNYADLNIALEKDERLQDPHSPGLFGKSLDWLFKEIEDPYTHYELMGWQIERPPSFTARMIESIKEVLKKHKGKTVFVVSHGDPTAFALWQLLYPTQPLPSLKELKDDKNRVSYLEKGEAWRILFDDKGNIVSHEHISTNGSSFLNGK